MTKYTELEEAAMLCLEIIRTCSHEKVAEAAVRSIGPEFRDRVDLLAAAFDLSAGAYVADLVRRFSEEAGERDMEALSRVIAGSDLPILDGLRWIVEFMIDGPADANAGGRPLRGARGAKMGKWASCASSS